MNLLVDNSSPCMKYDNSSPCIKYDNSSPCYNNIYTFKIDDVTCLSR